MKQQWLELTWPQRIIMIFQGVLVLLFLILYSTVGRQEVTKYRDEYLRCRTDGAVTTYSGKIEGKPAIFTVTENTVTYQLGSTVYGPYSIVFDPTAVPSEDVKSPNLVRTEGLVGVELWNGKSRLFRGAYRHTNSTFVLVDANGELVLNDRILVETTSHTGYSTVTTYVTPEEPGARTILRMALAPDVAQRGHFGIYLLGVLACAANAWSVLYADKLFRWNLRFRIRDAEDAEPSEWELFSRWISWIALSVFALIIFILGLGHA